VTSKVTDCQLGILVTLGFATVCSASSQLKAFIYCFNQKFFWSPGALVLAVETGNGTEVRNSGVARKYIMACVFVGTPVARAMFI